MSESPASPKTVNPVGRMDPRTGTFRNGFGLKGDVAVDIQTDYHSDLVDWLRAHDYQMQLGSLTIKLAQEFGFCYGVDKAIDFAYQTRRQFPDRRIFLTAEIIHNPRVNRRLLEMDIRFLSGQYADATMADVGPEDVVLLPAFGAPVDEVAAFRSKGCVVVDTTCGSVVHVWKRVEKYARDGFTSLIHGKYAHEETRATASQVTAANGHFLIVRDKKEAVIVCDVIQGLQPAHTIIERFRAGISAGFDPELHLHRIGVANQTTMLSTESLEVAAMVQSAFVARYGETEASERFRSFDTICSATQERQDAVMAMAANGLDLLLVVGGYNSSNTMQLLTIASQFTRAFHIEDAGALLSADAIRHKPSALSDEAIAANWLPATPCSIGITAGASTPNRAIDEIVRQIAHFYGLDEQLHNLLAPPDGR